MSENNSSGERRTRQRFMATRDGSVHFWITVSGQRIPLKDVSLDGFSMPGKADDALGEFDFEMHLNDIPDRVRGRAEAVNFVPSDGGYIGCRFVSLEGDGAGTLHDWLTVHVICAASIRISAKEAEAIVKGPSLI